MKNVPFIPLSEKKQSVHLLPDLTTYLVFDSEANDFYYEPVLSVLSSKSDISEIITSEKLLATLKQSGLISSKKRKIDRILLKHQNTGYELAIDCSHKKVTIESRFTEASDMPISYITDVCDLLTNVVNH